MPCSENAIENVNNGDMMCFMLQEKIFRKVKHFLLLIFTKKSLMSDERPNYWEQMANYEDFGIPSLSRDSFVSKKMDESENEITSVDEKSFQNEPIFGKYFIVFKSFQF